MQVSDDALGAHDLLTVELQLDAQDAVRGRVLRPHVDDQFARVKEGGFGHCSSQLAVFSSRENGLLLSPFNFRLLTVDLSSATVRS